MSKHEFSKAGGNIQLTKEERLVKLAQEREKKELSRYRAKLTYFLELQLKLYETKEEWETFFVDFGNFVRDLLKINSFKDDIELKNECKNVLILLTNKDTLQRKKYSDLIIKIADFFRKQGIRETIKLP
jgi:hypothetical protein